MQVTVRAYLWEGIKEFNETIECNWRALGAKYVGETL
jgi:hypothetical protein